MALNKYDVIEKCLSKLQDRGWATTRTNLRRIAVNRKPFTAELSPSAEVTKTLAEMIDKGLIVEQAVKRDDARGRDAVVLQMREHEHEAVNEVETKSLAQLKVGEDGYISEGEKEILIKFAQNILIEHHERQFMCRVDLKNGRFQVYRTK